MKTFLLLLLVYTQSTWAHEFKSKDYCSQITTDICGHIGYDRKPETTSAFVFTADIINKKKAKDISDMVIEVVSKGANGSDELTPTTWTIRPDGHHWDAKVISVVKTEIHSVKLSYKFKNSTESFIIKINE